MEAMPTTLMSVWRRANKLSSICVMFTWHRLTWTAESALPTCWQFYDETMKRCQRQTDASWHSRAPPLKHTEYNIANLPEYDTQPTNSLGDIVAARYVGKCTKSVSFTAFSALDVFSSFQNNFYAHLATGRGEIFARFSLKLIAKIHTKCHAPQQHCSVHSWVAQLGQATTPRSRSGRVMATQEDGLSALIGWYW